MKYYNSSHRTRSKSLPASFSQSVSQSSSHVLEDYDATEDIYKPKDLIQQRQIVAKSTSNEEAKSSFLGDQVRGAMNVSLSKSQAQQKESENSYYLYFFLAAAISYIVFFLILAIIIVKEFFFR
jgi:hypothetical protein